MLKQWRGIATRYGKNTDLFLAAVRIRAIFDWAKLKYNLYPPYLIFSITISELFPNKFISIMNDPSKIQLYYLYKYITKASIKQYVFDNVTELTCIKV